MALFLGMVFLVIPQYCFSHPRCFGNLINAPHRQRAIEKIAEIVKNGGVLKVRLR